MVGLHILNEGKKGEIKTTYCFQLRLKLFDILAKQKSYSFPYKLFPLASISKPSLPYLPLL